MRLKTVFFLSTWKPNRYYCPAPPFHEGYDDLSLGDYAFIDYKSSPGCSNFCQFGLPVEITCINVVTGIENQEKNLVIKMYPTITNSEVTIDGRNLKMVEFFDMQGMLVLRIEDLTSGVINVSSLGTGVYYVKVITASVTRIINLVKI